jgi:hypothetical protein
VSLYTKNVHFTKTVSGQTKEKLKKDALSYLTDKERPHGLSGKKTRLETSFCAIFILKMIILPRLARDKDRESTQKQERRVFSDRYASHSIRCWVR